MTDTKQQIKLQALVPGEHAGNRLDQIVAKMFPDYSRSRLQSWIKSGALLVDGQRQRPRDPVAEGALISLNVVLEAADEWSAEPLPLDIIYEDDEMLVLNKSAGVVVHPAAGHQGGTLLNGLLEHCPALENLPRAGIVHRLDKDTTGLMVVAKTLPAHTSLVQQLQTRRVKREYEAIVKGVLTGGGTVDAPLDRHPVNRKKRAVVASGKEAITHYRVEQRYRCHTHTQVQLETGRTHQIRVHMAHIGHPLVGDQVYGGRLQIPAASSESMIIELQNFKRQALHARRLSLTSPGADKDMSWEAPLPSDMQKLLAVLATDMAAAEN